jgi:RNA polymerase sigma factor (sigma-70 family)
MSLPQRAPRFAEDDAEPLVAREARATLEQLYREHSGGILSLCGHLLRDRAEAEDAAQQAFVSAFRALLAGTVPRDAPAWLRTIARNECWTRANRGVVVPLSDRLEAPEHWDPATEAIRHTELAAVWSAIRELPQSQRSALLLREVRGLTYEEVAAELGASRPSVRSLLMRARQTVCARLEQGAAAIGGMSWLNGLARLCGDASNPSLATATKTAAVGLSAVVLAGGLAVTPNLARRPAQARVASGPVADPHRTAPRPRGAGAAGASSPPRPLAARSGGQGAVPTAGHELSAFRDPAHPERGRARSTAGDKNGHASNSGADTVDRRAADSRQDASSSRGSTPPGPIRHASAPLASTAAGSSGEGPEPSRAPGGLGNSQDGEPDRGGTTAVGRTDAAPDGAPGRVETQAALSTTDDGSPGGPDAPRPTSEAPVSAGPRASNSGGEDRASGDDRPAFSSSGEQRNPAGSTTQTTSEGGTDGGTDHVGRQTATSPHGGGGGNPEQAGNDAPAPAPALAPAAASATDSGGDGTSGSGRDGGVSAAADTPDGGTNRPQPASAVPNAGPVTSSTTSVTETETDSPETNGGSRSAVQNGASGSGGSDGSSSRAGSPGGANPTVTTTAVDGSNGGTPADPSIPDHG